MNAHQEISREKYSLPSPKLAPYLLGAVIQAGELSGRIVETEAYTGPPEDYASHAYTRKNSAKSIMETTGRVYVYSIHNGLAVNITCGRQVTGAVLIRAIEPLSGIPKMITHRSRRETKVSLTWDANEYFSLTTLTNGPSKLAEALGIRKAWNNTEIGEYLRLLKGDEDQEVVTSTRIGISRSEELMWRYVIPDSRFLSRKP